MADIIINPCYDGDPLDGYTQIVLPSEQYLQAYWDVDLLSSNLQPLTKMITVSEPFKVRFRVVLIGELWSCICGDWCFNLGFAPIGDGKNFNLPDLVGDDKFWVKGWRGCDTLCIERIVDVPAGTIPVDYCGTLYECGGWFELHCCGTGPVAVVGLDPIEEKFFFRQEPRIRPKAGQ